MQVKKSVKTIELKQQNNTSIAVIDMQDKLGWGWGENRKEGEIGPYEKECTVKQTTSHVQNLVSSFFEILKSIYSICVFNFMTRITKQLFLKWINNGSQ